MDNDNAKHGSNDTDEAAAKSYRRKGLTVGLAAGLLGGTAAGLVFGVPGLSSAASPTAVVQQTEDTTPADSTPTDSTPADSVPVENAPTPAPTDDPRPDAGTKLREALQPLVDDGTLTAAQADAVVAQLQDAMPERGGRMGHGGMGHRGGGEIGRILGETSDVLTGVLGIDADTLQTELRDGKSLADIATENGVDPQAVIDALVAEATTEIDQAVTDGKMDADRADQMKADLADRIADRVNGVRPDWSEFPGHRGGPHDDTDPDDSTDAPVTTDN